jgi:hypothetical protein
LLQIPGVSVEKGHDDILLGFQGRTYWFEIKSVEAISKRSGDVLPSKLKPSQKKLLKTWKGHYKIVGTLQEILKEIGIDST